MNVTHAGEEQDYFVTCGQMGKPLSDCLVIDAHAHIGPVPMFPVLDSGIETLIGEMDRLGIDRSYVSGLPAVFCLADRAGNDLVIDAMNRYPDRIRGYMALNTTQANTILPEMRRCYSLGIRAVKIYSNGGLRYDHPVYKTIFEFADEHSLPIMAHTWGDELDHLAEPIQEYSNIRWLLAHTGAKDLPKYIRLANEFGHVYLETSFSGCPRGLFEELVGKVPLHKIIWGSDQIFMSARNQIGRVLFSQILPQQKQTILGANAAAFFNGNALSDPT